MLKILNVQIIQNLTTNTAYSLQNWELLELNIAHMTKNIEKPKKNKAQSTNYVNQDIHSKYNKSHL